MNLYNLVLGTYDFLVELKLSLCSKPKFTCFNFLIFLIIVVVGQVVAIIIITMNLNKTM